ncbi:MAG: hypothetical protein KKH60_04210, partial [Proteobacteria bacterium]|nr:hypothetical protein [Pseudomonadota bacterium]
SCLLAYRIIIPTGNEEYVKGKQTISKVQSATIGPYVQVEYLNSLIVIASRCITMVRQEIPHYQKAINLL